VTRPGARLAIVSASRKASPIVAAAVGAVGPCGALDPVPSVVQPQVKAHSKTVSAAGNL